MHTVCGWDEEREGVNKSMNPGAPHPTGRPGEIWCMGGLWGWGTLHAQKHCRQGMHACTHASP